MLRSVVNHWRRAPRAQNLAPLLRSTGGCFSAAAGDISDGEALLTSWRRFLAERGGGIPTADADADVRRLLHTALRVRGERAQSPLPDQLIEVFMVGNCADWPAAAMAAAHRSIDSSSRVPQLLPLQMVSYPPAHHQPEK